jgi:hypothetical protein
MSETPPNKRRNSIGIEEKLSTLYSSINSKRN